MLASSAEQEYFVDGMVEDIITGLSRIKWLIVIARNSSFTYKGKAVLEAELLCGFDGRSDDQSRS
jgi:TolB-like protein